MSHNALLYDYIRLTKQQFVWNFRITIISADVQLGFKILMFFGEVRHAPGFRTVPVSAALDCFVPRLV